MKKLLLLVFLILAAAPLYAQNNTLLSPVPKQQFFDSNGNPLAGGRLYSYTAGTTTPKSTYTDATGMTANANPAILDSAGRVNVWLSTGFYKLVLTSAAGVNIWTVDNIPGFGESDLAICGADGEVIFNRMGLCGHDPDFTYDSTTNILTSGNGVQIAGTTDGLILLNTLSSAGTWTFTLPPNDGATNQVLTTDGNGVTTWQTFTASGCDISGTLTTQIIFNSVGSCAGDPGLTYTAATNALNLQGTTSGDALSIRAHASTDAWTLILPADAGTTAQVLTSHGAAGTTWDTPDCILGSGQNTQVIYNNSGDCGSSSAFTFNSGTNLLTVPSIKLPGGTNGSVTMGASATGADWTLTLPNSDGNAGQVLQTDGAGVTTWASGGGTCPAGSTTEVQFNDGGSCGGDAAFVYDKTNNRVKMASGAYLNFDIPSPFTPTSQNIITTEAGTHRFLFIGDSIDTLGLGWKALQNATDSSYRNTCLGSTACELEGTGNVDSSYVTAVGYGAAGTAIGILNSTFVGSSAGYNVGWDGSKGDNMVCVGMESCYAGFAAEKDTAVGFQALYGATPGSYVNSVAVGYKAGFAVTTGDNNIIVGYQAADALTTGSGNIIICYDCDTTAASTSSQLKIGDLLLGDMTGVLSTATFQVNGGIVMPGTSGSITMRAPATTTTWALTLPTIDGDSGQFLQTNGSGVTTWASAGGGICPNGSNTYVQFSDGTNCDSDSDFTYVKANNTLVVGNTGTLFTRIDDNKVDAQFSRTPANESDYSFDVLVEVPAATAAGTNAKGIRSYVYNSSTNSPSDLTGAYIYALENHATSGNSSVYGLLVDSEASGSIAGRIDEQWGIRVRMLNTYRECDTGDGCNIIGVKVEQHISSTDLAWQTVKGIDLENNNVTAGTGIGEYDAIYIGNMGVDSGSVTEQNGILIDGLMGAGTAATNSYGVHINNQSFSNVGTAYALKIEDQDDDCSSCAGANWAIYTGDEGIIRFGGLTAASGTPNSICQNDTTKEITVNAALTCTVSARDQKNSIAPLEMPALALIHELLPVSFKYNDKDRLRYGFIAEDVAAVDPRFGDGWKGDDARSIDMPALLAVSVKAIQELEDRVRQLEDRK